MEASLAISDDHRELVKLYGLFMVTWSIVDHLVQTAIWKELGIDLDRASYVTAKLQFYPRAQLLRNLLKMHGDKHKAAMDILEKMEVFAQRNTMVHGQIVIGDPKALVFVKSEGVNVIVKKFKVEQMREHVYALSARSTKLQDLLGVSEDELQQFSNHLVSKGGGIPQ